MTAGAEAGAAGRAGLARVCVYCGSQPGAAPAYADAAAELGTALAEAGLGLVFGGGRVGLMGAVADATLRAGGTAIGVIPRILMDREVAHMNLTELHVVDSMHERKARMADLADAFVALPGGLGTLEEIAEMLTWAQLGLHRKPCALLNVAGFHDQLVAFLDHAAGEHFIRPAHRALLVVDREPRALIERLREWEAPDLPRVLSPDEA